MPRKKDHPTNGDKFTFPYLLAAVDFADERRIGCSFSRNEMGDWIVLFVLSDGQGTFSVPVRVRSPLCDWRLVLNQKIALARAERIKRYSRTADTVQVSAVNDAATMQ